MYFTILMVDVLLDKVERWCIDKNKKNYLYVQYSLFTSMIFDWKSTNMKEVVLRYCIHLTPMSNLNIIQININYVSWLIVLFTIEIKFSTQSLLQSIIKTNNILVKSIFIYNINLNEITLKFFVIYNNSVLLK